MYMHVCVYWVLISDAFLIVAHGQKVWKPQV